VTTVLRELPDLDSAAGSGIVARRAVSRWGWRLFRREWRQQLLVLGLLTVAVAATVWGASVVTNAQLANPNSVTYGTGAATAKLPGRDPHLAANIATIQRRWGPADVIENQNIATGTSERVQLRAESPHGHYNAPLLGLVSGSYPAGPGQVALTSQVAALYGTHVGGTWRAAGTDWRVTGIVQDPSNLADVFALVAPGQVRHPSQVTMLLGPAAARLAASNGGATLPGVPAAALAVPNSFVSGFPQATLILVVEVLGLAFIGLVSVASFSVMAQRRLRALGMLGAIGATGRNLRLVMITSGLAVGVTGALAGAAAGLAAWFAYVPTLQQATGHVVDAANLPWWAFAIGVVFAIATSVLASRRPAKAMAAVPVVTALSGRPAPPRAVHRSALPGVFAFAFGLLCLAFAGGQAGPPGGGNGPGSATGFLLVLLGGLVGTIAGMILLAPLAIGVLTPGAGRRLPVAVRIALRDLVRYRARSGAALAAVTFAVFLATVICLVGSERAGNPLSPSGPNLSSSQLVVTAGRSPEPGMMMPLTSTQEASLGTRLNSLAASLHARSAVPLENASTLSKADMPPHSNRNFNGNVYVATPQLLATYGIKASQIAPGTDILTSRPGLAGLSNMEMIWQISGNGSVPDGSKGDGNGGPSCTLSSGCLANPTMQTVSNLPSATDAPNTVITEYAVRKYHLQTQLTGWLIQAPAPLTAAQIQDARRAVLADQAPLEIASGGTDFAEIAGVGTALGILIALGVLAASVGLIRSETSRDLRTLTAIGGGAATRRTITAATAAALGLLGAILGMAFALVAALVWAHASLSALFGDVPLTDVLILLLGLPLAAAAGGWLFAGRKPPAIARQPIE
jgi:putative ABC transport system permease protein